jgi:hypothetical protein
METGQQQKLQEEGLLKTVEGINEIIKIMYLIILNLLKKELILLPYCKTHHIFGINRYLWN